MSHDVQEDSLVASVPKHTGGILSDLFSKQTPVKAHGMQAQRIFQKTCELTATVLLSPQVSNASQVQHVVSEASPDMCDHTYSHEPVTQTRTENGPPGHGGPA